MHTVKRYTTTTNNGASVSNCQPEVKFFPNFSGSTLNVGFAIETGLHIVFVGGDALVPTGDYTYSGTTLTFIDPVVNLNVIVQKMCADNSTSGDGLQNMGKYYNNEDAIAGTASNPALNQYLYRAALVNEGNVEEDTILFIRR